jgi:hypothetical protein
MYSTIIQGTPSFHIVAVCDAWFTLISCLDHFPILTSEVYVPSIRPLIFNGRYDVVSQKKELKVTTYSFRIIFS